MNWLREGTTFKGRNRQITPPFILPFDSILHYTLHHPLSDTEPHWHYICQAALLLLNSLLQIHCLPSKLSKPQKVLALNLISIGSILSLGLVIVWSLQ